MKINPEEKVVKEIILDNYESFYNCLGFMINMYHHSYNNYPTKFYVGESINRNELGFENNKKPGDFDIIVIPEFNSSINYEKSFVIEVKIIRPNFLNLSKSPNSYGTSQIKGLIEDGFPYIGILYYVLYEGTPKAFYINVPIYETPEKTTSTTKIDPYLAFLAKRQFGKLEGFSFKSFIGYDSIISDKKYRFFDYENRKEPSINPDFKQSTLKNIKFHFESNRSLYTVFDNKTYTKK